MLKRSTNNQMWDKKLFD